MLAIRTKTATLIDLFKKRQRTNKQTSCASRFEYYLFTSRQYLLLFFLSLQSTQTANISLPSLSLILGDLKLGGGKMRILLLRRGILLPRLGILSLRGKGAGATVGFFIIGMMGTCMGRGIDKPMGRLVAGTNLFLFTPPITFRPSSIAPIQFDTYV